MSAVDRPVLAGTEPQAVVKRWRPASRLIRPGSSPGARPMSRAPKTLPRRSAGRNLAFGRAAARTRTASAATSPDSA